MSFDISKIPSSQGACEAGYAFEPRYPDNTPTGATITVRGPESSAAKAFASRRFTAMQMREIAARKSGRDLEPVNTRELEEQSIDLAVAYTIGWSGFTENSEPLEATAANLRAVYTKLPWVRSQVISEAQELGNFVRPPPENFSPTPPPSSAST